MMNVEAYLCSIKRYPIVRLLLIDNYDSFTYNLWNYLNMNDVDVDVAFNDQIGLLSAQEYDALVLSPGPGVPSEAGIIQELIDYWAGKRPILGICLGHQALAEVFGGSLTRLPFPYHGISQNINLKQTPFFDCISSPTRVGLYHSWAVERVPDVFEIIANNEENITMAIFSERLHLTGVQFHPESIMTSEGFKMIRNWIKSIR